MVFYIGDRIVSENTINNSRSSLGMDYEYSNIPDFKYRAELNLWEYAGSFRYNFNTSVIQPFIKAGYGLSWYRLENAKTNDQKFEIPNSDWIRKPSLSNLKNFLPNTWHIGGGIELALRRDRSKVPAGIDVRIRADYTLYGHKMGLDLSHVQLNELDILFSTLGNVPSDEHIFRQSFSIGLTVGF
jgi:hypothetical protein